MSFSPPLPSAPDTPMPSRRSCLALLLCMLTAGLAGRSATGDPPGRTVSLVSRTRDGGPPLVEATCYNPAISADGRYVAFASDAINLLPDADGSTQVYRKDRQSGAVERISQGIDGKPANSACYRVALSADGRYAAFSSIADNLVPGDTNRREDVFVRDFQTGKTEPVSVAPDGTEADGQCGAYNVAISLDGRYVAFEAYASNLVPGDTNAQYDVFVRDRQAGTTERVSIGSSRSEGNGSSGDYGMALSGDGNVVAFVSSASNLVSGDTNGKREVFVRDRRAGTTERASVGPGGVQANDESRGPALSRDGRCVGFQSGATNLLSNPTFGSNVFLRDRQAGVTELISIRPDGTGSEQGGDSPALNADGTQVAYVSTSGVLDESGRYPPAVFVRDRNAATTTEIAEEPSGAQGYPELPQLNGDGRLVAYILQAANSDSGSSGGNSDVFVADRLTRAVTRASETATGHVLSALGGSGYPTVTPDGRFVAFVSNAYNLVTDDSNGLEDVFVSDRSTGAVEMVSVSSSGTPADGTLSAFGGAQSPPGISADGRFVVFASTAPNLTPGIVRHTAAVFVRDRVQRTTELIDVTSDGSPSAAYSLEEMQGPGISADGRYVAFASKEERLVPGDTNRAVDVFVRDRIAGRTERVSVASGGAESHSPDWPFPPAGRLSLSADGRFIAFGSEAADLVPGDTNNTADVFVHDRQNGVTERVSVGASGAQGTLWSYDPTLSADGRLVCFGSAAPNLVSGDTNGYNDLFVRDRAAQTTERVSLGNDGGEADWFIEEGSISPDGRFVAFSTRADGLVPGDTGFGSDVFLRDRARRTTEWIGRPLSEGTYGASDGSVSAEGRVVAFGSSAPGLAALPGGVRAYNVFAAERGPLPPLVPAELRLLELSPTSVLLGWDDRSDDETAFVVELKSTGDFSRLTPVAAGVTSYRAEGLLPGTRYTFRVRALRGDVESDPSSELTVETPAAHGELQVASTVDFGRVRAGRRVTRILLVRNRSAEASLAVKVDPPAAPFTIVSGGGRFSLKPGGAHRIHLAVRPRKAGMLRGTLTLHTDDPERREAKVQLKARAF